MDLVEDLDDPEDPGLVGVTRLGPLGEREDERDLLALVHLTREDLVGVGGGDGDLVGLELRGHVISYLPMSFPTLPRLRLYLH